MTLHNKSQSNNFTPPQLSNFYTIPSLFLLRERYELLMFRDKLEREFEKRESIFTTIFFFSILKIIQRYKEHNEIKFLYSISKVILDIFWPNTN